MNRLAAVSTAPTADDAAVLYVGGMSIHASEPHLRATIVGALQTPGSLTRLKLALLAGRALRLPRDAAAALGAALEYFHTASLLIDDLPCMDDAETRRGRPCAHRIHGEGTAILGALSFINRGYSLVAQSVACAPAARRAAATAHVERCLGPEGVLGGQSLDLHFAQSARTPRDAARAALGKTVPLLRFALVTPALLVGAAAHEQLLLNRLAVYWGLAYQLADDFSDLGAGAGKTAGRDLARDRPNFAVAAGHGPARDRLCRLLHLVRTTQAQLAQLRPAWQALRPLVEVLAAAAPAAQRGEAAVPCA